MNIYIDNVLLSAAWILNLAGILIFLCFAFLSKTEIQQVFSKSKKVKNGKIRNFVSRWFAYSLVVYMVIMGHTITVIFLVLSLFQFKEFKEKLLEYRAKQVDW